MWVLYDFYSYTDIHLVSYSQRIVWSKKCFALIFAGESSESENSEALKTKVFKASSLSTLFSVPDAGAMDGFLELNC